jgi:hypothetical protein
MQDQLPPSREYVESINRRVVPYLLARGLSATGVMAGCARCQACSSMAALERATTMKTGGAGPDGRRSLPLFV